MDLVRDVLDKAVLDRNGREIGRADGIVVSVHDSGNPRVIAVEVGPAVLAYRFHPLLGRIAALVEEWLGLDAHRPTRIGVDHIDVREAIVVDVAASAAGVDNVERAVRKLLGAR